MILRSFLFAITFALLSSAAVFAQRQSSVELKQSMPDASNERGEKTYTPGDPILETMTKMRIRAEEKEHQEFIQRGADVQKLTAEISQSFQQFGSLEREAEKLNQLEKNFEKSRGG